METTSFSHYRSFQSPASRIWPCLTVPDHLAGWIGEADLELGHDGTLSLKTWNGDAFQGRVIAAVPTARMEFAWRPFDFDPESHVTWRLGGDGPGSRLTVIHDGLRSREERDHARLFWRDALDALAKFADGEAPSPGWGGTHPVTVRALLPRTAADVWPVLSTAPGLAKWVANVEQFEAQPGSTFRFRSRYRGQDVLEQGVVQEIVPESRLRLSWEWVGERWAAPTEVLFALEPEAGGTSLLISHSGFERIEVAGGADTRRNYASGWAEVLADLKRLVSPVAAR
ncbi:MAG TPA: SRPBCC family protein [Candidatus Binatia bacterium]|nr:SRPBCC family protein [Candidatus Binatia bacterium]